MDGFGKLAREVQIGGAGFAPDQIGVRGVSQAARDGLLDTVVGTVETFNRALTGEEGLVMIVNVGGHQIGGFGIGTGQQNGRHTHDVGSQARCAQLGNLLFRGHQHFATHVAAFLDRSELIFKVNTGRASVNH